MLNFFKEHHLAILLPLAFSLYFLAFRNIGTFWYMYTFSLLVLMSFSTLFIKISEELATWKSLLYGLGYGTLIYAIVAVGYHLIRLSPFNIQNSINGFLDNFAPTSIWHFLLLMFIIVPGEEIFWRGYIQQKLKKYFPGSGAVLASSALFALAIGISGFIPGIFAAAIAGIVLGFLYEWKKSMPLLIVTHLVMIVLLFLIRPLSG